MILTDKEIEKSIAEGTILIEPYRADCLGTNSYDVHLGRYLAVYKNHILDAKKHNEIEEIIIPDEGFVIHPGILYLGVTEEYTETHAHVPFLEGKSSVGRLGIDIHATAGKGDVGFCNTWTLEISCSQPVRIYAGMPLNQWQDLQSMLQDVCEGFYEQYFQVGSEFENTGDGKII